MLTLAFVDLTWGYRRGGCSWCFWNSEKCFLFEGQLGQASLAVWGLSWSGGWLLFSCISASGLCSVITFAHWVGTALHRSPCYWSWQGMVYSLSSLWPQLIFTLEDTEPLTSSNRDQVVTLGSNAAPSTSCLLLRICSDTNSSSKKKCKRNPKFWVIFQLII